MRKLVILACMAFAGCGEGQHTITVTPNNAQIVIWDSDGQWDTQHMVTACRQYNMAPKSWKSIDDGEAAIVNCLPFGP